jgi:IS30 family transposase
MRLGGGNELPENSLEEREEIFKPRYIERQTLSKIGQRLGKDKSSISREIKRGAKNRLYNPLTGEAARIDGRKRQCPKLKMTDGAWRLIKPKLEKRRPPAEIEQWLSKEHPEHAMSGKTIYNCLHFHMKGELKKPALGGLRQKGKKRRKAGETAEKRGKITEMALIGQRPAEVGRRGVPGHREGDLITGAGHKSALRVIVERKSRFAQIGILETYTAGTVRETIERRFKRLGSGLVKTITFDQGKENSGHKALAENAGIKACFCHPHPPWEKGACENTNYLRL